MRFFKSFGSKKKDKGKSYDPGTYETSRNFPPYQTPPRSDLTARLPPPILERIFGFVCPHSRDETYESCEHSAVEDACMLCDLRDLAHCTAVSRRWRKLASNVLYHSIRIDAVHYCEREEILAEKRKHRSFFDRNAEPEDPAQQRLRLLCRTLRETNKALGVNVQFFKIPYMTRETCKADLARTVAVLPNLRYVDLPEGFFTDDPSCHTLKQEVQARCPDIRKMTYNTGAEQSLEMLTSRSIWQNLEVLELSKLNTDPQILRYVVGSLPNLRALKITEMKNLNDSVLISDPNLPPIPPLVELLLEETPNISAHGLVAYLSDPSAAEALRTLSITNCGFQTSSIHFLLSAAYRLQNLSVIETVSSSFPAAPATPLLSSITLKTLHYEITANNSVNSYNSAIASHYAYLTSSLLANGLPALTAVYVRDPDFPGSLLDFAPPRPAFVSDYGSSNQSRDRFSSNNPFAAAAGSNGSGLRQELEVYTKGLEEMEWNFARVDPASEPGRRGSMTALRPVSAYGLVSSGSMSPSWTGGFAERSGVRKSVMVGNGFGGFLAVPAEEGGRRPSSSSSAVDKRSTKYDMWR